METNMREETMDLDLNLEPLDPSGGSMLGLGSLLSELEIAHGRIEERIRQLEAVTFRARQRQRWRQGQSPQPLNIFVEQSSLSLTPDVSDRDTSVTNVHSEASVFAREVDFDSQVRTVDDQKNGKRNSSHLVAKALEMDTGSKKAGGDFFDCNICLYMARDPILTCCGHLFCWPCFYQLSYANANVKECPECKGDVTDTSIIPIYGNGSNNSSNSKSKLKEPCLELPPRPKAPRIESVRQQLISRRASSSPIEIVNNIISAVGERTRSQQLDGAQITGERTNTLSSRYPTSQALPSTEIEGNQGRRSFQVSRMLLHGAASFSFLSSALNSAMDSAERLMEDFETYINNQQVGRNQQDSSHVDRDSTSSIIATVQPESLSLDTVPEIDSLIPFSSLRSLSADVPANNVAHLDNQTTDSTMPPASSSRGSTLAPSVSDTNHRVQRQRRRRRLRRS